MRTFDGKTRAALYSKLAWVPQYLDEFIEVCQPRSSDRACDIGTGTGVVAHQLAQYVYSVDAVDNDDEMLKLIDRDNPKITVIKSNIELPREEDATYDLITARMVLHHTSSDTTTVDHCVYMLNPGGRVVIAEGIPPQGCLSFYKRIFELKEPGRRVYTVDRLIALIEHLHDVSFRIIIQKDMSITNWLGNSGLDKATQQAIFNMHLNAPEYVKKAYNMRLIKGDIITDWQQCIVTGVR